MADKSKKQVDIFFLSLSNPLIEKKIDGGREEAKYISNGTSSVPHTVSEREVTVHFKVVGRSVGEQVPCLLDLLPSGGPPGAPSVPLYH